VILPIFKNDNADVFYKIIETMGNASLGLHLSGEKGLGKEAIVRLLYDRSPHRGSPFIKVNCPMLSVTDGNDNTPCFNQVAFRKNVSSFNLFRLFYQGVLYLHSVDEMDMALQGSLLALVNRKFQSSPFSSNRPKGGLLIFSTSTRPLEDCLAAGTFNPELYQLLSGLSIHIPPLHQSPERISPLVDYFLNRFALSERQDGFAYPSAAHMATMKTHRWPGNVKELQEIVKTALRLNDWDSAIVMLNNTGNPVDSYSTVDLSLDGVSLMPDFEIRKGRMLECLEERLPTEEMGLMDLVIYEGAISPTKLN